VSAYQCDLPVQHLLSREMHRSWNLMDAYVVERSWISRKMNSRFLVGWTPTLPKGTRVELSDNTIG